MILMDFFYVVKLKVGDPVLVSFYFFFLYRFHGSVESKNLAMLPCTVCFGEGSSVG